MACALSVKESVYGALLKLACKRCIAVIEEYFTEDEKLYNGFLVRYENQDCYIIILNKYRTIEQKIFTLAHELGHYALHI
ncbi:hypothetical protein Dtox_3718 [Desulfofarcimen acetoxidans DSM 771]|uniref:IrrE N-terminal-like domain-containing protein n=1 Tax=Desulfofarcimen acetoxidans (strain ATCC 49208 / DSM 771 / KCTC 5769 / VKM B-1644 / 5575) TaxID=485916 RepID=C8VWR2_DESAS|nr:ImmA/IrrE family metallo-endopeptidase [Desulfofarcimen acetoxidans]ACV64426.1 hypothetical protein Dtox_3718 [Desulfofarcimen acetoxidans DSM 771]